MPDTKERLKKIICAALNGCPSYISDKIADALILNGVMLPPVKEGDNNELYRSLG